MDVNVKGNGSNASVEQQVEPTHQAARISIRPTEHVVQGTAGGHFLIAVPFTTIAGQFNAPGMAAFALRWTDSKILMIVHRVAIAAVIKTAFGASQIVDYDLVRVTSWDKNPTGGAVVAPKAAAAKMRSNMAASLLAQGACLVSGGAPIALNGDVDAQAIGAAICAVQYGTGPANTGVAPAPLQSLYELRDHGQHPLILGPNEGFAVRNGDAYGATGVVKGFVLVEYAEVASY